MKFKFVHLLTILSIIAILALGVGVVSAQDDTDDLTDTITVTGTGIGTGAPDIANLEIGVENISENVADAFSATNDTIDIVVQSIIDLGVAPEDIRTVGLNVYSQERFPMDMAMMEGGQQEMQREYRVSNTVRVTVRDIEMVEDVLDTAISNGANNIFGLHFGIDDRDALEQTARVNAMENARERASQLAEIMGVELGDAIIVVESSGGSSPFDVANLSAFDEMQGLGGGNASVSSGQLSVNVRVQVTFSINR